MKDQAALKTENALARPLAPEDVRCGEYVSLLNEVVECPSFFWCGLSMDYPPEELIRIKVKPKEAGVPMRVESICLPFIALRTPMRQTQIIDVRRVQLVRLSKTYAKSVWKAMKKDLRPELDCL